MDFIKFASLHISLQNHAPFFRRRPGGFASHDAFEEDPASHGTFGRTPENTVCWSPENLEFLSRVLGVEKMQCDIGTETKFVVDKLNLLIGFEVGDSAASKLCEFTCTVALLKKRSTPKKRWVDESCKLSVCPTLRQNLSKPSTLWADGTSTWRVLRRPEWVDDLRKKKAWTQLSNLPDAS